MTAFETAWDLMKMPMAPHTVRFDYNDNQWKARFIDPVTNEKIPMMVRVDDEGGYYEGYIGNDDGGRTTAYGERSSSEGGSYQARDVRTQEPYLRRGYAKNLYDLIAYALSNLEEDYDFVGDSQQSVPAKEMWDKYADGEGVWAKDIEG